MYGMSISNVARKYGNLYSVIYVEGVILGLTTSFILFGTCHVKIDTRLYLYWLSFTTNVYIRI